MNDIKIFTIIWFVLFMLVWFVCVGILKISCSYLDDETYYFTFKLAALSSVIYTILIV